jgi:glycosyltransferase involved in cell wall biosynthesis
MRDTAVSVIIPTRDRARLVPRAVNSVLRQSLGNLECIVVDDGSTDDTRAVLASIRDPRLRVIRTEARGVSAARNCGLAKARGKLLALLDSDDEYLPEKLERQSDFMLERSLEISQTEEIWIRRGVRVNPKNKHSKADGRFFTRALSLCLVSPSCVMFTREFWAREGLFDENLPACEDYDFWLRILSRGREVGLLSEALTVKHGGRPDQLSRSMVGLDLFRVYALLKLVRDESVEAEKRLQAERELRRKAAVYVSGCQKRGRLEEAARVMELLETLG